jgi:hypothetical protein
MLVEEGPLVQLLCRLTGKTVVTVNSIHYSGELDFIPEQFHNKFRLVGTLFFLFDTEQEGANFAQVLFNREGLCVEIDTPPMYSL